MLTATVVHGTLDTRHTRHTMVRMGQKWFVPPEDEGSDDWNSSEVMRCLQKLTLTEWDHHQWSQYQRHFVRTKKKKMARRLWAENTPRTVVWENGTLHTTEPCNGISNWAYYREAARICDRAPDFARVLVMLGFGSFAFHTQPNEKYTHQMDVQPTQLFAELALALLNGTTKPDLTAWGEKARLSMESEEPLPTRPGSYEKTFDKMLTLLVRRTLPPPLPRWVVGTLRTVILDDKDVGRGFETAVERVQVQHPTYLLRGMALLLQALVWQEEVLPTEQAIQTYGLNKWMGPFAVKVSLRPSERNSPVYPGQRVCRSSQSHSMWHELSAMGLADLALGVQEIFNATSQT